MGSSVMSQIGGLLGEDAGATQKGVDAALPALLGGLMGKVSGNDTSGASSLLNLIKTEKHDGSMLNNFAGLFSGGEQTNSLLKMGTGLLSSLFFGNRSNGMFDLIGRAAGFRNSRSSSSILGMLAPILLNFVGKKVMGGGLDALGLKKLLLGQKDHVKSAAPAGLASALGLSSFDSFGDSLKNVAGGAVDGGKKVVGGAVDGGKRVVSGVGNAGKNIAGGVGNAGKSVASGVGNAGRSAVSGTTEVAKSGGGLLKKLLPLAFLLIAGLIAWPFLRGCGGEAIDATKNVANKTVQTTKNAAGAVVDGTKNVAGKAADATKNAGNAIVDGTKNAAGAVGNAAGSVVDGAKNLAQKGADFFKFAPGTTEGKFANFLTDSKADLNQSFVLDKVFFETGSANLKPESKRQLNNIVKVMKAYPKVNIQTQGHTDNVGNAANNKTLSQKRADSVKAYLQQQGVPANRMTAKGFGDAKPRAKNDSAANKAKNRRTELKVTKR